MLRRSGVRSILVCAAAGLVLTACKREAVEIEAPPRSETMPPVPSELSYVSVPVTIDAAIVRRAVEQAVPRTLWRINRHFDACIEPQRVKAFGRSVKVTPKIGCDVVGQVTRGPIRLTGRGDEILAEVPLRATIAARDIGGVLKGETATGAAKAYAVVKLDLGQDWKPRAKVDLRYDWTRAPGIDFLGKRITFTDQADEKLRPVVRQLERELPRELARIKVKPAVTKAWTSAFTVLSLNAENPPVWLRLTPQEPVYGGFRMNGNTIRANVGLKAVTETFVGNRPEAPQATPLPAPARSGAGQGLQFFVPVTADYAELEPVITRALAKRARRPFDIPRLGAVDATFSDITAYGTDNGRIAVGMKIAFTPRSGLLDKTEGRVWMTALPVNEAGSSQIAFRDVKVTGDIARTGGQYLVALATGPALSETLANSLTQNFADDIEDLTGKIRAATARRTEGDFRIATQLDRIETGELKAYGSGLYLPVRLMGKGDIAYRP